MKVVILAGGAARGAAFTEYMPKPMMPVCGKPIVARVMEIFARQGHVDFILSVGYRKEIIVDYFETRRADWRVTIVDTAKTPRPQLASSVAGISVRKLSWSPTVMAFATSISPFIGVSPNASRAGDRHQRAADIPIWDD